MLSISKKSSRNNRYLALVGAAVSGVLLLSAVGTVTISSAQFLEPGQDPQQLLLQQQQAELQAQNDTRIVAAGGGGPAQF
jgi:hypothetical protein